MIASVGDICIDRYMTTGEKLLGGIATNFAIYVHDQGAPIKLIGAVGQDEHAKLILKQLKNIGLDTETIHQLDGLTAVQNVRLAGKERDYCGFIHGVYENFKLSTQDFKHLQEADLVVVPLTDGLKYIFDEIIYADLGSTTLKVADFSRDADVEGFMHGDVISMLQHYLDYIDMAFIGGDRSWLREIEAIAQANPQKMLVYTLGSHGSLIYYNNRSYRQPAPQIMNMVDTTGCGDAFRAGFLTNYLVSKDIRSALQAGNKLAGEAGTYFGGNPYASFTEKTLYNTSSPKS